MFLRSPRRTPAVLGFVALLSTLPMAVHALPSRFEERSPVVWLQAGDWLSRLGEAARTLWTKAVGENGIIIDPDGQPTALPGDEPGDGEVNG